MKLKKIIAGALIGGAAVMGISLGAGHADAKIAPGKYKFHRDLYGVIPLPDSNARVIGNRMYSDYLGVGPWNLYNQPIVPTRDGGDVTSADNPTSLWLARDHYTKTRDGYRGTNYGYGNIPFGNSYLKKVN